jgi:thioredoxin reductase (NADPH)
LTSHATSDSAIHNMVIVGSGPAGYTAAIYAARADLAPVVIAGSVTAGGALMNTTEVENYPGFPDGLMGPELMESMRKQAERFGANVLFDDVTELELSGPVKTIHTGAGQTYHAQTVLLATGSAYREIGLESEKRLSGRGVSWCATCDGFFFRDKDIVVVGGGDSAMEEATFLSRFARSITVVHRRDTLRASKIMQDRAHADPKITFAWNSVVTDILGQDSVTGVELTDTQSGQTRTLDVQGVFVAIGHDPRTELFAEQVKLEDNGFVHVHGRSSRTTLPGVFACGDVTDHEYMQAVTAAGSGCVAALDAEKYLATLAGDPGEASTARRAPAGAAEPVSAR